MRPALAKSELEIARIVWQRGRATVRQVCDALPLGRELDFWTVQTYLRRLAAKGYLNARREGRTNIYTPRVRPGKVVGEVVDDLLRRLFDGRAWPLVQHLLEDHDLTDDEIEQLQSRLNELKGRRR